MYDCVLFDIDGTLTDSARGILSCVDYALERMGRAPVPEDMRRLYVGPPLINSFMKLNGMSADEAMAAVRFYRERYEKIGWKENRVYEGIPRLLRALKANGVYLGVATAKPVVFARRVLEYFGLSQYFNCISAAPMNEAEISKSELIRRALPASAQNPAMVGDRLYDIQGAKQAGLSAVGALYGYGTIEELEGSGADMVCRSVSQLSEYLLQGAAYAPGTFITFEGIDGCGKTTQLNMLKGWLLSCGWRVVTTREPGGCPIGEKIREMLLSVNTADMTPECEALLFAASRAQHTRTVLRPELKSGNIVLGDRYVDSSIAYQGCGRGLGAQEIAGINRMATGGLKPDMTLFYDLDPSSARARRASEGGDDRIERERDEFHARVRAGFQALAAQEPERIKTLDAALDRDTLFYQTRALAMRLVCGNWSEPDLTPAEKL